MIELQYLPWTKNCVNRLILHGRCKSYTSEISSDIIPRLSYYLQRILIRLSIEIQRFSSVLNMCTKHDILSAYNILLSPNLADSCKKACLQAATMFTVSGDSFLRGNKSLRADLYFNVGMFHRWMIKVQISNFVHE